MRAHAALLLLSVAITSALRMNYKSEANRDLIITRLPVLAICDVQYPLTEAKADYDTMGPGSPAMWEDVGLTKPDFFGVAKAHGLWPTSSKQGFSNVLLKWGLGPVETDRHHRIRFANFSEAKTAPMSDSFNGAAAASRLNPIQLYIVPTAEHPLGWDYFQPTPADDSSTNDTHGKAAALKRDRPAAGAVADQDTAGLDDLPRGEETPSKRQAAASISSSSLGESEVGSTEYQKKRLAMMMPLIKPLEDNPHVSVIEFSSQAGQKRRISAMLLRQSMTPQRK